jgi:hypothetical protein
MSGRKVHIDNASSEQIAAALGLVRDLERRCGELETDLLRGRKIADVVLDAERPGTSTKREDTALEWLAYLLWLLETARAAERPVAMAKNSGTNNAELDAALSAAAAEKPEPVRCSDGTTRYVYPKSYHSLEWLTSLDVAHRAALDAAIVADALAVPEDRAVSHLAPLIRDLHVRLWAWILTFQGPGLPFADDAPLPEPPRWTGDLSPDDLFALLRAHHTANVRRLSLIARAFPSDADAGGEQSRLSLSGFIAAAAAELEPNAARRLIRETSLGQLFATRVAAAESARASLARAKQDA